MTAGDQIRFTRDVGNPRDELARTGELGTIVARNPWCYVVTAHGREYLKFAADEGDIELFAEAE